MKLISLLFREKKYIPFIICIVALLIVQVFCELALPRYTGNIVDIGIMQGGVEDAVPNEIRQSSMDGLKLFMTVEEREKVDVVYKQAEGGRLVLDETIAGDAELRAELAGILSIPEVVALQANTIRDAGAGAGAGASPPELGVGCELQPINKTVTSKKINTVKTLFFIFLFLSFFAIGA